MSVALLLVAIGIISLTNSKTATAKDNQEVTPLKKTAENKLNELQRTYVEWTGNTFSSFLCKGKFDDFSPRQRLKEEKKALALLKEGKAAGIDYYVAINALGELKSKRAVRHLLKIAADRQEKDNRDRWMATRAIGLRGNRAAVPTLIHLVYHYNQNTRMWAQISLVRLTGQNFGTDYQAWGNWWAEQGGKPKFKNKKIVWTTSYPEYADPAKQKESDELFLKRIVEKSSGSAQQRRQSLRSKFTNRSAKDKNNYTSQQLREIESLYQVANKKWRTQEAKDSLKKMLEKYDKANRTGCALLYMGQMSSGRERQEYLLEAIKNHSDCWYGDGVNVGAYARLYLAGYYKSIDKTDEAVKLWKYILEQYPDAITHNGQLLRNSVTQQMKEANSKNEDTQPSSKNTEAKDPFVGWYLMPGDTVIPILKTDGTYYSVCRGFEIPFKQCDAGLEWDMKPSSMVGTTIGFNLPSNAYYISIVDQQTANFVESYVPGVKQVMTKIDKPSWLLDAAVPPPKTNDDFLGCYQPTWFPYVRFELRKDGEKYFVAEQELHDEGSWNTRVEPRELTPLTDRLGFGYGSKGKENITYNESLKRFELTMGTLPIRMPLSRVPSSSRAVAVDAPVDPRTMIIGIPTWH